MLNTKINNDFAQIINALQPEATIVIKPEYGSSRGEIARVVELEDIIESCSSDFFGTGGTCFDISNAWRKIPACGFSWGQAVSIMICSELVSIDNVSTHTVLTTWMRLLATQGKCLNKALAKYYAVA